MYKRLILLTIAIPIMLSGVNAAGFFNKFSFSPVIGGIIALDGNYTDSEELRKILNPGLSIGAGLRFEINENFYLNAEFRQSWISLKSEKKPFIYKEMKPAFNMQMFMLNGIFYLKSGYQIEPYLTLGAGLCPWWFSKNGISSDAWPVPINPENSFSKKSLGLNVGLGFEIYLFSKSSVYGEFRYYYVFARDVAKFGTNDFTEQDFFELKIGMVFYFGKK